MVISFYLSLADIRPRTVALTPLPPSSTNHYHQSFTHRLQTDLDKAVPNACAYVYMDAVAFIVPPAAATVTAATAAFTNAQLRDAVYHGCGLQNISVRFEGPSGCKISASMGSRVLFVVCSSFLLVVSS